LNISATSEASDFKFATQLGFAKAHYEITPRGKSGGGFWLGELLKILESPTIFLQPGAKLLYNLIICDYLNLLRKYF